MSFARLAHVVSVEMCIRCCVGVKVCCQQLPMARVRVHMERVNPYHTAVVHRFRHQHVATHIFCVKNDYSSLSLIEKKQHETRVKLVFFRAKKNNR